MKKRPKPNVIRIIAIHVVVVIRTVLYHDLNHPPEGNGVVIHVTQQNMTKHRRKKSQHPNPHPSYDDSTDNDDDDGTIITNSDDCSYFSQGSTTVDHDDANKDITAIDTCTSASESKYTTSFDDDHHHDHHCPYHRRRRCSISTYATTFCTGSETNDDDTDVPVEILY